MTERDDGIGPRRGPGHARQLVLDLARDPSFDPEEFLVSASNAAAHAAIERWPTWSTRTLLLIGPPGSGKSHLGAIWAARARAQIITISRPATFDSLDGPVTALLESCDDAAYDQSAIFHLVNVVAETSGWLLMTARSGPAMWAVAIPDLLSRLRVVETITIQKPDIALIKAVMVKLFTDRQIRIDEEVVDYAALHCEQSLDAINVFVTAVDADALASGRRITRPLAIQTINRLAEKRLLRTD